MRAFFVSCVAVIVLAVCGVLALGAVQKPSGVAFSTEGARIDPGWSWRQIFRRPANHQPEPKAQSGQDVTPAMAHLGPEDCKEANAYRWLFVDFGEAGESDACAV